MNIHFLLNNFSALDNNLTILHLPLIYKFWVGSSVPLCQCFSRDDIVKKANFIFFLELPRKTDGNLNPAVAESYNITSNGMVYTFALREGV